MTDSNIPTPDDDDQHGPGRLGQIVAWGFLVALIAWPFVGLLIDWGSEP